MHKQEISDYTNVIILKTGSVAPTNQEEPNLQTFEWERP